MSLYIYNPSDRYRKRFMERMTGLGVVLLVMLGAAGAGFFFGRQVAFQDQIVLREQAKTLAAEKQQLENTVTELKAEAMTATSRYEALQKTYQETIPEGPVRDLIALVHKQLADGMDPERLTFLIHSARPPRNCTEPETKRFVVSTPAYKGPDSEVSIAEGIVIIKGNGVSARNASSQPEAWFDASKAITLEFTLKDGRSEKKEGVLPIHHSLIMGEREYRFTVAEGARSFAKVTFDSCDYP